MKLYLASTEGIIRGSYWDRARAMECAEKWATLYGRSVKTPSEDARVTELTVDSDDNRIDAVLYVVGDRIEVLTYPVDFVTGAMTTTIRPLADLSDWGI